MSASEDAQLDIILLDVKLCNRKILMQELPFWLCVHYRELKDRLQEIRGLVNSETHPN